MDSESTVILDLNDDCLLKIMEHLDALDLCAIKDTCQRFRNLSAYYFETTYKQQPFDFGVNRANDSGLEEADVTKILLHFGQYINKLEIACGNFDELYDDYLNTIAQHCNPNLKELVLNDVLSFRIETCNETFSNLERILFMYCYYNEEDDNINDFLNKCKTLKHLEIYSMEESNGLFLAKKIGQLESLRLEEVKCGERAFINRCLLENSTLRKLEMIKCNFINDFMFKIIADNLLDIEEVYIQLRKFTDNFDVNVAALLKLEHLKRLEFNCGQKSIVTFVDGLAANNKMEYLSISDTELNKNLCKALIKLKKLKSLKLISMRKAYKNYGKLLVDNLYQLEQLFIVDCHVLALKDVFEIVETAVNLKKLLIKECNRITGIDCNEFLELVERRKKINSGFPLTIYLAHSVLKTSQEIISKEALENGAKYIQLRSTSQDEIRNERFISDKGKNDGYDSYEFESTDGDEEDYLYYYQTGDEMDHHGHNFYVDESEDDESDDDDYNDESDDDDYNDESDEFSEGDEEEMD